MKVRIKKLHENAVVPKYAHATDAGLDLTAVSKEIDKDGNVVYHTGLAFEIPEGYMGLIFPRSSNAKKHMYLTNSVGVVDAGFRNEVLLKFKRVQPYYATQQGYYNAEWNEGDRVGQLIIMPYPSIEFEEVEELSDSDRGMGGYGSTGE